MNPSGQDPFAAIRHPDYRRYLIGYFFTNTGRQALIVAATWQIYQWTHSATALGLVGLVNVVPLLALILPAGTLADRVDRRLIIRRAMVTSMVLSLLLAALSHWEAAVPDLAVLRSANAGLHALAVFFERGTDPAGLRFDHPALPLIYLLLFLQAVVRVLANPARGAIVPLLVPPDKVGNAVTWSSSSFELATVIGPALGGLIIAVSGYAVVYLLDAVFCLGLAVAIAGVVLKPRPAASQRPHPPGAWAGVDFIWRHKPILAALALDLFAVVLGGATALLPIYADQILHIGPAGLGWLRAAPALGAITMAVLVTHLPPLRRPGLVMLWSVAGFGLAIVVFGLSRNLWLSLLALYLSGMCDNVSVVVRHTLVQLLTPDALRGRVTSVNQLFIGSSNEISALRAGLMGAVVGPVAAVAAGGVGTVIVVGLIALLWPSLARVPPLHTLRPEHEETAPDGTV